jgi:hypothetical protein
MPISETVAGLAVIAVVKLVRDLMSKDYTTLVIVLAACAVGVGISFLDPGTLAAKGEILRGLLWGLSGSGVVTVAKVMGIGVPKDEVKQ